MGKSKVSIVKCAAYDPALVLGAVTKAVGLLGGIDKFVKRGEKVMIKPNVLSARQPDDAVCTHPEVVRAVIRLVKETGAIVSVGDSPGGFLKNVEEVYEVSGIGKVAREEKVNLIKFTFSRTIEGLPISARVLDSDKIISVPKFKTHEITGITAGVKNMYGAVVGLHKTKCHADAPTEKALAKILARVFLAVKPTLTVLDAIVSMEGEGPSSGIPRKTDFVMASSDAVALDSILSVLIGTKPLDYAVIRECKNMDLGESDPGNIDIVGGKISDFVIKNFRHARGRMLFKFLPEALTNLIAAELKFWPDIDIELCKKCNMCKSSCPVGAISVVDDNYRVKRDVCIRCMCCREVCPYKAIGVKKNWLAKMLWE
jgi:uncharacterized protein (DUF362 family)/ferredoxin